MPGHNSKPPAGHEPQQPADPKPRDTIAHAVMAFAICIAVLVIGLMVLVALAFS